jgi:hypothetical protein
MLIDKITKILKNNNYPDADTWTEHDYIKTALEAKDTEFERLYVNRYWREKLQELTAKENVDTSIARFALADEGTQTNYLNYFKDHVVPVLLNDKK